MRRLAVLALAGIAVAALPALAPVQAQDLPAAPNGEKVNTLIIYGDDPCPNSKEGEITVCARKAESERYRIPEPLRVTPSAKSEAWKERVLAYETVGATGTNSCSAVGPGGSTGCLQKLINNAYAEKRGASDVQFSKMIEEERAKRMATVDADAKATQGRVEQAEKDYAARQRGEQDKPAAPGVGDPTVTAPVTRP